MKGTTRSFRKRFYFRCPLGEGAVGMDRFSSYWKDKWSPLHNYDLIKWLPDTKGGCIMIELSGMTILHFEKNVLFEPVDVDYMQKKLLILNVHKPIPLAILIDSEEIKKNKNVYAVVIKFKRTKFLTLDNPTPGSTNWKLKKIREDASAYLFQNTICCIHLSKVSNHCDLSEVVALLYFPNELLAQVAAFEILEHQNSSKDIYNFKFDKIIERTIQI